MLLLPSLHGRDCGQGFLPYFMNQNNNSLPRPIELLAPAKNLEQGIIAIDHGADAV